jgi:hypothetical protein
VSKESVGGTKEIKFTCMMLDVLIVKHLAAKHLSIGHENYTP